MSGRTQRDRLRALASRLSERNQAVVADVVRLRFLTAGQIARLHFSEISHPSTRIRTAQRDLGQLVSGGLLVRLERRVGGVRAGSTSFTYSAAPEASRLESFLAGNGIPHVRRTREPGATFVDHTVAASEVYVRLVEAARDGTVELIDHEAEPDCWREYLGAIGERISLRPDAFVSVGVRDYELRSFVEIDRGTEGSAALRRKLDSYVDYWRSGTEQRQHVVFPRVVWQVEHARRAHVLERLIGELPEQSRRLFTVTRPEGVVAVLASFEAQVGAES